MPQNSPRLRVLFLFFLVPFFALFAAPRYSAFVKDVVDPLNPTEEEYRQIQERFCSLKEEELPFHVRNRDRLYYLYRKFVSDNPQEHPVYAVEYINKNKEDRRCCIIMYATFNSPYPENLYNNLEALKKLSFDGHVIYRVGGFPTTFPGSLDLIGVPYAFKWAMMKEAQLLGYKNVLWLDTSLLPKRGLEQIFAVIEKQGSFFIEEDSLFGMLQACPSIYHREKISELYNLSFIQTISMPRVAAGLFGLDLHSVVGKRILDMLGSFAFQEEMFENGVGDEVALTCIIHKLKIQTVGTRAFWAPTREEKEREKSLGFGNIDQVEGSKEPWFEWLNYARPVERKAHPICIGPRG